MKTTHPLTEDLAPGQFIDLLHLLAAQLPVGLDKHSGLFSVKLKQS